jgi:4,5-DOPA dioxygenase extradiol
MRMPTVFLGHGNPMNAIERNAYTEAWSRLAATLPRPELILSISAHWYIPGSRVTVNDHPRTIHDFGGFPRALYDVHYPAPGSPALAERVRTLLAPTSVALDASWGLDHGTWSLLVHLFPQADIPVVQLGIDETMSAQEHFALATRLRILRDEGVLILGSGNVVHNLHTYAWGQHPSEPYAWAVRFEARIREHVLAGDTESVAGYEGWGPDAELAVPTP